MRPRHVILAAATALVVLFGGPSAMAQDERIETEGSADFRNPPILVSGSYSDTIVTGETVWYSVVYTNNTPYRIEVSLADVDLESQDELTLTADFIGPTLGTLGSGTVIEGPGASYDGGTTNVWYVSVDLATTGQLGSEHRLNLDLEGFSSSRLEYCDDLPDCVAADELQAIQNEIARLEDELAALDTTDSQDVIEDEIAALRAREAAAAAELQTAESEIAELCQPDTTCDAIPEPSSSTPVWATALGVIALIGGGVVLVLGVRSRS